jgi:hypothetical protein
MFQAQIAPPKIVITIAKAIDSYVLLKICDCVCTTAKSFLPIKKLQPAKSGQFSRSEG